jgi:excisionase family DNA binding protein
MPIDDLATHTANFVTVGELAEYWGVSRQQIYKRIESGVLEALCFGARLYRVRTSAALEYERCAKVTSQPSRDATSPKSVSLYRVR